MGLGPAAHSFMEGKRFFFPRDTEEFIAENPPTADGVGGAAEEFLMLSLRLSSGLSFSALESKYGITPTKEFNSFCEKLIKEGLAEKTFAGIRLTSKGFLMQNPIVLGILESLGI